MRKLFVVFFFALLSIGAYSQSSICCPTEGKKDQADTTQKSPLPTTLTNGRGAMIKLNLADRSTANAYLISASKKSNKWLFIFHEKWGLNNYIKNEAEGYAEKFRNLNVLAIDLYDGEVTANSDSATILMKLVRNNRSTAIIEGAKKYVGTKAEVGTLGWCFGGGMSMQAAIILGKQAKACVVYYGIPETNAKNLKNLYAPVLGIFAEQDKWVTREVVNGFIKAFRPLKRKFEIKWFDAAHAFANPSNPDHNSEAAKEAEAITLKFMSTQLMGLK
jgi:carboxymethylenebutenolidase